MAFDAKLGTQQFTEKQVVDAIHPAVIRAMAVKASQGELAKGLIVAKNGDGEVVPYKKYSQSIGTGDGTDKTFGGTLTNKPVGPGSLTVTAGAVTLTDDGNGNIKGTGGTGYVNYATGAVDVEFDVAPAAQADIACAYANDPVGVLVVGMDTTKETTGSVIRHGTVVKKSLLVDTSAPAAADIAKLEAIGIFAR